MATGTYSLTNPAIATLLVSAEDGVPALIQNNGPNQFWVGNHNSIRPTDNDVVPIQPNGYLNVDGSRDVYGIIQAGNTTTVFVIDGGTNFFSPPSLSGLGGISLFVQPTTPTGSIPLHSLWFNTSNNSLQYWNGSVWVVQAFAGNQLITAGTIVANLLAAGIVVAGIIDGTIVQAAQIIAHGATGQFLVYTGTPAAGNMLASISGASGTDSFGNKFPRSIAAFSSSTKYIALDVINAFAALYAQDTVNAVSNPPVASMQPDSVNGCFHNILSGFAQVGDTQAEVALSDSRLSGVVNGQISLIAGKVFVGNSSKCVWDDNAQIFQIPRIIAALSGVAETWHDMRPLSGSFVGTIAGQYPPQFRLAPDGFVEVFGYIQAPGTGNPNGITFANLPAAYRPGSHVISWPITMSQEPSATVAFTPRCEIDTLGNLQLHQCPTAFTTTPVFNIMGRYPLDNTGLITS